jgi:hypothetical protein
MSTAYQTPPLIISGSWLHNWQSATGSIVTHGGTPAITVVE